MSEHYIIQNQPSLPFVAELSAPVHSHSIRNWHRTCRDGEVDVSAGVRIEAEKNVRQTLAKALEDFRRFCSVALEIQPMANSYPLNLTVGATPKIRNHESYQIDVRTDGGHVRGTDIEGLRRSLYYLEDEMARRRGPFLPKGRVVRACFIRVRISRSPYASYRYGTGWELENDAEHYPTEYLNRLAHAGINAIWVAGFYRNLIATRAIPELGPRKTRLHKLRRLIERAARYGIRVYFFCMEPRIILDQTIFRKYPDIRGTQYPLSCSAGETALCTSVPRVQAYVREATAELFRSAPGLAGLIDIFAGERATNCWYNAEIVKGCPRCLRRPQWEVLAELLNCLNDGMKSVAPTAELLAWDYSRLSTETKRKVMENMRKEIVWLGCFEHGGKTKRCGQVRTMDEYSLSYVGPAVAFRRTARAAQRSGKRIYAKLQIGNTYEQSSLPHVPVPSSVYRKFRAMDRLGVDGTMASWIIGGFPSFMLKAAGEASFQPTGSEAEFLRRLAALEWGEDRAKTVAKAWQNFFKAYRLYPAMNDVFYFGPITRCPAYHLSLEPESRLALPYNWGLTETRKIQPFEDNPKRWLGGFTEKELINSFRRMAKEWTSGLRLLREAAAQRQEDPVLRQLGVAQAAWIQFRSCANVIEFYMLRNQGRWRDENLGWRARERMRTLALDEIALAQQMKELVKRNPTLGFESELRYYSFSKPLLDAKIRQVGRMLKSLRS